MKRLVIFALALAAFVPVVAAQTGASFTGKWEGTIAMAGPDGSPATRAAEFNLAQKGDVVTGTAGPPGQQRDIEKGTVKSGTATFEVASPAGAPYKFVVTIEKGRLQGTLTMERDGQTMTATVDAAKAPGK